MADSHNEGGDPQPQTLKGYIISDVAATILFTMRMVTLVCTIIFVISTLGLLGDVVYSCYYGALGCAFFTFSMRLYQRKQQAEVNLISREMLNLLTTEDSGHYMLYTFFYYNQPPLSIYLLPVLLYAVLLSVGYTQGLAPFLSGQSQRLVKHWNEKIAKSQQEIKRFIAYTEIFLMIIVIWNVLSGYIFFLAPFLHYHFLRLRYTSKRNPYVRIVFSDLRMTAEYLSSNPRCPSFLTAVITKVIGFISRLAPTERMQREA